MAEITAVQLAALRVVERARDGIRASSIGYSLLKCGAVKTDRPKVKAQGAALIAARPMYALERAGLVRFEIKRDGSHLGYVLTVAGSKLLAQHNREGA